MTGAMYAAVAGLRAHMSALNVIGNNISNVNTMGYKSTRYTFSEALYTTVRSGSNGTRQTGGFNPAQIGFGASVGTIDLDMSTKNYSPTGIATDCMIDGDGFFIVGNDKTNTGVTRQAQLQGMSLTRLGNFEFKDGYMVDGNGSIVYGFLRTTSLEEYQQENPEAEGTEEELCSHILTPIRLPMCTITSAVAEETTEGDQNASKTVTNIYWPVENEEGGYLEDSQEEGVERLQATISIDGSGRIMAMTKDDQSIVVGLLAIAQVDSPNGVTHTDGRYYKALGGAGNVHLASLGGSFTYIPEEGGEEGAGLTVEPAGGTKLITGGLESSGTDLANEISNMIMIQRGYQANTRIVTVTDSMLEELVNIKR